MDTEVNKKAKYLSGGEIAKLTFAMATSAPIDLLILDEPTNNLDIDTSTFTKNLGDTVTDVFGTLNETTKAEIIGSLNKLEDDAIGLTSFINSVGNSLSEGLKNSFQGTAVDSISDAFSNIEGYINDRVQQLDELSGLDIIPEKTNIFKKAVTIGSSVALAPLGISLGIGSSIANSVYNFFN